MYTFTGFEMWKSVVEWSAKGRDLYYHAPMDVNPKMVYVSKFYKNGKIRISSSGFDFDAFTADPSHLEFFRRRRVD